MPQSRMFLRQSDRDEAGMMRLGNAKIESQRDCVTQPRVARNELPWVAVRQTSSTPTGLWPFRFRPSLAKFDTTPLGLKSIRAGTQGSSFLAPWDNVMSSHRIFLSQPIPPGEQPWAWRDT